MPALMPWIKSQFFDHNGDPLEGGKVYSYKAGTSIPMATFADRDGNLNPNPVILDSAGEASIWLGPEAYKFVITDDKDVVLKTIDKVAGSDGAGGGIVDSDYTFNLWSGRFNEQFTSDGLMDTLTKILKPEYSNPLVSLTGSSNTLREKGTVVSGVNLLANIQVRSSLIGEVRFYLNPSTLLDTQTSGGAIPNGGNSTYSYSTPFSDNVTFRVEVDDVSEESKPSSIDTVAYSFVYPYFDGANASSSLTAAQVATLTKRIINSSASIQREFTATAGQYLYFAQPSDYPPITQILDVNNFDVTPSWDTFTGTYTANDTTTQTLRVYRLVNPVAAGLHTFTFKR